MYQRTSAAGRAGRERHTSTQRRAPRGTSPRRLERMRMNGMTGRCMGRCDDPLGSACVFSRGGHEGNSKEEAMGTQRKGRPRGAAPTVGGHCEKTTSPKPIAPLQRFRRGSTGRRDSIPVVPNLVRALGGRLRSGRAVRATGFYRGAARSFVRLFTPISSKRLCNKCTTFPPGAHRPSGLCPIVQVASLVANAGCPVDFDILPICRYNVATSGREGTMPPIIGVRELRNHTSRVIRAVREEMGEFVAAQVRVVPAGRPAPWGTIACAGEASARPQYLPAARTLDRLSPAWH
jgi:antitoxin (DNA-binding transcriptional repressor) of toxin-antitoxin stability system